MSTETTTKPKVYAFINGSDGIGGVYVVALAEDGTFLAAHASSNEGWARRDIGLDGSTRKHDNYATKYPEGFEVVWLDPKTKPEDNAIADELAAKNQALAAAHKDEVSAEAPND